MVGDSLLDKLMIGHEARCAVMRVLVVLVLLVGGGERCCMCSHEYRPQVVEDNELVFSSYLYIRSFPGVAALRIIRSFSRVTRENELMRCYEIRRYVLLHT